MQAEKLSHLNIFNDSTGNRTRHLPSWAAESRPAAAHMTPRVVINTHEYNARRISFLLPLTNFGYFMKMKKISVMPAKWKLPDPWPAVFSVATPICRQLHLRLHNLRRSDCSCLNEIILWTCSYISNAYLPRAARGWNIGLGHTSTCFCRDCLVV
jgi:hypothetical protein